MKNLLINLIFFYVKKMIDNPIVRYHSLKTILTGTFLSLLISSISFAQTNFDLKFLRESPQLSNKNLIELQNLNQKNNSQSDDIPKSYQPQILNSSDQNKLIKSNASGLGSISGAHEFQEQSQIKKYYELLVKRKLPVYGQNLFSQTAGGDSLFYNTQNDEYKLAPGDVLEIIARGLNQYEIKVQVNRDGKITLPEKLPIYVEGVTINSLENDLIKALRIDDASAAIDISLNAARLIPIQITGTVKNPRTVAVPAYTPLSRVLPLVGGIRPDGSLRNLTLTIGANKRKKLDLYDLLRDNGNYKDPLINDYARIHINDIGVTVAATGLVGRPGIFELPENDTRIRLKDLLLLANGNMIPPGATIEIIRFNQQGVVEKQKVSNIQDQYLRKGEVLNVALQRTTNFEKISVEGVVQEAYEISTNHSVSLAQILKNGATLRKDSLLDFALIKRQQNYIDQYQSIDLRFALNNPDDVLVEPGDKVVVFNPKIYDFLLNRAQDHDRILINKKETKKSDDSSKIKELKTEFSDNSYEIEEKLALLFDIEKLLMNTQKVYIDDKISSLIPDLSNNSLMQIINEKVDFPQDLNLDFGLKINNFGKTTNSTVSFSPKEMFNNDDNNHFKSSKEMKINLKFYSNNYLSSLFKTVVPLTDTNMTESSIRDQISKSAKLTKNEINLSRPIRIFVDSKLNQIISNNMQMRNSVAFNRLKSDPTIYPFFVRAVVANTSNGKLITTPKYYSISELNEKYENFVEVEFFTHKFVRSIFSEENIDLTKDAKPVQNEKEFGLKNDFEKDGLNDAKDGLNDAKVKKNSPYLNLFKRNSKFISGALENPGFYPIIGQITLEELISIAGGVVTGADLRNVTIRKYGENMGVKLIIGNESVDILSVEPKKITIDGHFTLYIPYKASDADVGTIEIEGEVLHPGSYSFSRNETLEEVLNRAGGLTETAYPLGASFFRESLKSEQKLSNENLAREVEQSILFLSQSQLTGAGDQIEAVIAYADQLKQLPTTGKQILNLEGSSKTMILEDGDVLKIPKRPSHVTISGSVQNPVTSLYETKKSLKSYISEAGGLKRNADKKAIFVLLPNGKNITLSGLETSGSIIPAGSVIVVPPKTDKISALGLTDIWSRVLGNIATSILAINAATK